MSDVGVPPVSVAPSGERDASAVDRRPAFHGRFEPQPRLRLDPTVRVGEHGLGRVDASGMQIRFDRSRVDCAVGDTSVTLCQGRVRRLDGGTPMSAQEIARELLQRGNLALNWLGGRFALIHLNLVSRTAMFVSDRFAVYPICYRTSDNEILFSDRADSLQLGNASAIDPQSIFNYVYFHVIPAPRTAFRGVVRIESAQIVQFGPDGLARASWWQPSFEPESAQDLETLKSRFRMLIQRAVEREATTEKIGCFLSGGTDSSTIAGMLCKITGRAAPTFSIGFDVTGYDEMTYARIAARHFGTEQHEYYLSPEDLVQSIPSVAAQYDQPFGNSSGLPAYFCALRAKEAGIEKLLAGDGGDELFGGNSRYAKQQLFDLYSRLPRALRMGVLEPLVLEQRWPSRVPLLKKLASYVKQARLPLPERMETYNLLARFGATSIFTNRFLAHIDQNEPISLQRDVYGRHKAPALIDRMLAYDWRFTLADNDLPKVTGTAHLAGQTVGFPMLDDELVDFSLRLPPQLKLRGLTLRYFFKEALRGFLPEAIIRKRKHGFGLPFGPWLVRHEPLRALAQAALERLVARGFIRNELVQELFSVHFEEHAAYFGEMVWILMMLEHWLAANAPDYAV